MNKRIDSHKDTGLEGYNYSGKPCLSQAYKPSKFTISLMPYSKIQWKNSKRKRNQSGIRTNAGKLGMGKKVGKLDSNKYTDNRQGAPE